MEKTVIASVSILLLITPPVFAESPIQFPPSQAPATDAAVPVTNQAGKNMQVPTYYYPQYMTQYPFAQGYVPTPYGYALPYNPYQAQMVPQQMPLNTMNAAQATPQPFQYASPYNPNLPATPGPKPPPPQQPKKVVKPWGDTRYIWPDFYTDFTGDAWDGMINAPHEMGYMPGGWRFPSFSSPDPVTVGDAVANQVPPILEEIPNFIDFAN